MFTKINTFIRRIPWAALYDMRTVGQLLFLVIVLLITWSGIKTIQSNYGLQKQISTLAQQNQLQQLENDNLRLQNEYYNTDQYQELSARQEFGLGVQGETELLVPQSVALAHLNSNALPTTQSTQPNSHQSKYEQNFQAWMNFFLHRTANP